MGGGDQHARAGACFGRVFAYQKVFSTPSLNDAHVGGDSSSARATGRATSQVVAIRRMTATSVVAMGEDTTSIAGTDRAMLMLGSMRSAGCVAIPGVASLTQASTVYELAS